MGWTIFWLFISIIWMFFKLGNWTWAILGMCTIIIIVICFFGSKKLKKEKEKEESERKRTQQELQELEDIKRKQQENERIQKEKDREEAQRILYEDELRRQEMKREEHREKEFRREYIKENYNKLKPEEIIVLKDLSYSEKIGLLIEFHGFSQEEAGELVKTAVKEEKRLKLKSIKRKISQKMEEQYNDVPVDDRQPITEEVKMFVWKRDAGKCVKCGSNENLEFDHIIPFSKGGSNTERNIQLLCEKCNREKSDKI